MGIHQQEEVIFNEWVLESIKNGHGDNIAPDGLLFRGQLSDHSNGFWYLNAGREEELWDSAEKRLLILTKDLNNANENGEIEEAWDIRQESGLRNALDYVNFEKSIPFYKRLMMWSYGILKMSKDGSYPSFEEARDMSLSGRNYIEGPIARINCKKQCGKSTISDEELSFFMETYSKLLIENINIYHKADILLCCAYSQKNGGVIKNFIQKYILNDLIPVEGTEGWIYYSPSTNKVLINSWHPSCRKSYKKTYENMMSAYSTFIKRCFGRCACHYQDVFESSTH